MLGGTKQRYIWTINGTLWSIVDSLAGTKILAEMYGDNFTSTWEIPETQFDAEFVEAKDLRYIGDVLDHQPVSGYSSRLLRSDYSGFSTEVQRASDSSKLNVGFEDAFDFDVPAFDAFIAATTGSNRTWYDQFGANNASQTTFSRMPVITSLGGNFNRPAYTYDGSTSRISPDALATSFTGINKPFTFLSVIKSTSLSSTRTIVSAGRSSSATPFIYHNWNNSPVQRLSRRDDASTVDIVTAQAVSTTPYFISGIMFDQTDINFILNGLVTKLAGATLGQTTLNRFTIGSLGRNAFSNFWQGNIDEVLIWDQSIGLINLQQASYNMNQFYAVY